MTQTVATSERSHGAGLRTRQARLTKELVMEALAALIAERGVTDFSIQDVAERAGVSHRTVYRHYPTREAMLEAVVAWGEARMAAQGGMELPRHPEEIGGLVRRKFEALDQMAPFTLAALKLNLARLAEARQGARSREATRAAMAETTGHLAPDVAEVVAAVIRHIGSSQLWLTLRDEEGIDGARSAPVVIWAIETLVGELRAGRGPGLDGS